MAKILVVDDDARVRQTLENLLVDEGYRVYQASDGNEGLKAVSEHGPDLVIMDVVMPNLGGLEALRILKSARGRSFLPVILLTSRSDGEMRLQGLRLGADDYLIKPPERHEVVARIQALLRIKRLQDQITSSQEQLKDEALVDALTGLYNSAYLHKRLSDEFNRSQRYNEPMSLILIELTNSESQTPVACAAEADQVVTEAADLIKDSVREFDVVIRRSGFAFAVLLPRTHFAGSMAVAGRLWSTLIAGRLRCADSPRPLTADIGVAFYPDRDVASEEQVLLKAERALGLAHKEGPGQICLLQQTTYFFRPDK